MNHPQQPNLNETAVATGAALMPYSVMLPWAWDLDPSDEEGTYATVVYAANEEQAVLEAAEEMADSAEKHFFDEAERLRYIQTRGNGFTEVVAIADRVLSDLGYVFDRNLESNPQLDQVRAAARALVNRANETNIARQRG